jgi:sugar O-acyltransferase (sialic acid O-acetyltransferase NeuD family)
MDNYIIIGARGFGREILSYVEHDRKDLQVKGFLDTKTDALSGYSTGKTIIGDPFTYEPVAGDLFFAAVGDPADRFTYTEKLREFKTAEFPALIHSTATVSQNVRIGRGSFIGPRAGISVDVEIGEFTAIQELTLVGHDAKIGNWCQINGHCMIAGGAQIGNFVTIHPNSVITKGAKVGDGVKVSAGSVVYGTIPPNVTVLGNPAKRFQFK